MVHYCSTCSERSYLLTHIVLHIQDIKGVMGDNEVKAVSVLNQYRFGEACGHNVREGELLATQSTHHVLTAGGVKP